MAETKIAKLGTEIVHHNKSITIPSPPINIRSRSQGHKVYKKDGYRQRNVRQFLHILASPRYAPGTIAVNVTWMERGFNAGQTHSSIYQSIFNRLRAIARYWSEIAT